MTLLTIEGTKTNLLFIIFIEVQVSWLNAKYAEPAHNFRC